MATCASAPEPGAVPLKVGDVVSTYWKRREGWGYVRTANQEKFTVRSLSYSAPRHPMYLLAMAMVSTLAGDRCLEEGSAEPAAHQLMVDLAQTMEGEPWYPGSTSSASTTLSYDELQLWVEGDVAKLELVGLTNPPDAIVPRRWWQFWK